MVGVVGRSGGNGRRRHLLVEGVADEVAVVGQVADQRVFLQERQVLLAWLGPFEEMTQGAQPEGAV